jgi:hypothetical protein
VRQLLSATRLISNAKAIAMTVAVAKSLQGKPRDAEGAPGVPQPLEPAHVINDDAEA